MRGPLLWQHQSDGWLLTTSREQPQQAVVDAQLQEQGLSRSELDGDEKSLRFGRASCVSVVARLVLEAQLAVAQARSAQWIGGGRPSLLEASSGLARVAAEAQAVAGHQQRRSSVPCASIGS
jgi:hypothetical protein